MSIDYESHWNQLCQLVEQEFARAFAFCKPVTPFDKKLHDLRRELIAKRKVVGEARRRMIVYESQLEYPQEAIRSSGYNRIKFLKCHAAYSKVNAELKRLLARYLAVEKKRKLYIKNTDYLNRIGN